MLPLRDARNIVLVVCVPCREHVCESVRMCVSVPSPEVDMLTTHSANTCTCLLRPLGYTCLPPTTAWHPAPFRIFSLIQYVKKHAGLGQRVARKAIGVVLVKPSCEWHRRDGTFGCPRARAAASAAWKVKALEATRLRVCVTEWHAAILSR